MMEIIIMQGILTKNVYLLLAKSAPVLGGALVLASLQAASESLGATIWRIVLSAALAVFVTMVGAIYQNLNRRIESLEDAAKTQLVQRNEYETYTVMIKGQLDRIEQFIMNVVAKQ